MAIASKQQWTADGGGETQPRERRQTRPIRYGGECEYFDLGSRQAAASTLRRQILNESGARVLAATGVSRCKVGRAAFPDARRADQCIIARQRQGRTQRDHAEVACTQLFEAANNLLENLARSTLRLRQTIARPRGGDDQSIDEAVLVAIVGSQEDVLVPPGRGASAIRLVTGEQAAARGRRDHETAP